MTVVEIKAKIFDLDHGFKEVQEQYRVQAQNLYKQLAEATKKEKDGDKKSA